MTLRRRVAGLERDRSTTARAGHPAAHPDGVAVHAALLVIGAARRDGAGVPDPVDLLAGCWGCDRGATERRLGAWLATLPADVQEVALGARGLTRPGPAAVQAPCPRGVGNPAPANRARMRF